MALVASGIALGFGPVLWTLMFMLRHTIANLCWAFAKSKNKHPQLFDMWLGHSKGPGKCPWGETLGISIPGMKGFSIGETDENRDTIRPSSLRLAKRSIEEHRSFDRQSAAWWKLCLRGRAANVKGQDMPPCVIFSRTGPQETVHVCFT